MKQFTKTVYVATMLFALAVNTVFGQGQLGLSGFSAIGAQFNASAKTNIAIISDNSTTANAQVLITYVNASVDGAVNTGTTVGTIELFKAAAMTGVVIPVAGSGFTNSTSNYFILSTNNIAIATNLVIEHISTNQSAANVFEFAQVFGIGTISGTNITGPPSAPVTNFVYAITNTTALAQNMGPGDIVYAMTPAAQLPLNWALGGTTNLSLSGFDGIYTAPRGSPVLATVIGTTNGLINCISAKYVP